MKFNWGTGITIVIILFMGFILMMVFKASQTDADLNAENYYEQEITYQDRIDAIANATPFEDQVEIVQKEEHIQVSYPAHIVDQGTIQFFKPDDASLDIEVPMDASESMVTVDGSMVVPGRYDVKLSWSFEGEQYYLERAIVIR